MSRRWFPRARGFFDRSIGAIRPRLESLEDRSVPAVNVFARGDTLFIQGDQTSNAVEVAVAGTDVRVTTDRARPQTFTGIASVFAALGAGADRFAARVDPSAPPAPNNPQAPRFALIADLGVGNDSFDLTVAPSASGPAGSFALALEGGDGSDTAGIFVGGTVAELSPTVNLGAGNDRLALTMLKVNVGSGAFDLDTASGDDVVFANLSEVQFGAEFGSFAVRSGAGADEVALAMQKVRPGAGEFVLDTGAGNDEVALVHTPGLFPKPIDRFGDVKNLANAPGGNDSDWIDLDAPAVAGAEFTVLAGPGHDEVFVGLFGSNPERGTVTVLTAEGDDTLNVLVQKVRGDFKLVADTGAGDDIVRIAQRNLKASGDPIAHLRNTIVHLRRDLAAEHFSRVRGSIRTGAGDDQLTIATQTVRFEGEFLADTGAGDDVVVLSLVNATSTDGTFRLLTGSGADALLGRVAQSRALPLGFSADLGAGNDTSELLVVSTLPRPPHFDQWTCAAITVSCSAPVWPFRFS